jgi:uncharacterized protein (TIGR03435 family)
MREPGRQCYFIRPFLISTLVLSCIQTATAQSAGPAFEVASVKPAPPQADPKTGGWNYPGEGRFVAAHVPITILLQLAYGIDQSLIANKPGWLEVDLFDIEAKAADGIRLSREELKPRLQDLLRHRFHLVAHMETRQSRGYALVVAKGGPHLTPTKAAHFPGFRINVSSGQMRGENWSMAQLAGYLTPAAGFPVVDQTGIGGSYDIAFSYAPNPDSDATLPSLDAALKEATGLLLKPQMVPAETLVIDSVDRIPTAN